jgi:acetyl esterase/lipase
MDRPALDAAYNNGAAVANSAQIIAGWQRRSDALRAKHAHTMDMRYGDAPRNCIDYFEADEGAPLLVFIHGGYWQSRSRELFAFLAAGPLAHGINVALAGYTLAPEKRLDAIAAEIAAALDWISLNLAHSGIYLSGWSAGGHLTAMAMPHAAVRGGLAISGVYDLEPIRLCYLNEKLGLDEAEAKRNSPLLHPEAVDKPLIVAYGKAELPELQRQSETYARSVLGAALHAGPGHNHFTILEELASPKGALTGVLTTMVRTLTDR